ncbi:hypothetical protein GCM10023191_050360 [Actinoallomurus oryzae]|uniref:Uncharacterized protein n=1 Tax=Actinoallomurus oryzae TaxID=502180 RepID=A0ABP8QE33_9ACTN
MTPRGMTEDVRSVQDGYAVADRYARFYPVMALGALALAFLPLFDDVTFNDGAATVRDTYGTVFDMARRPGGGPAVIGMALLFGLVAMLAVATFAPPRSAGLPSAIAVVAALIVLLLITKPGTDTPKPHLSDGGTVGLVLVICATVLGAAHAVHLTVLARRSRQRPAVSV